MAIDDYSSETFFFLKTRWVSRTSQISLKTLGIMRLPNLSVCKFTDNVLENWCHAHFSALGEEDGQALACFPLFLTDHWNLRKEQVKSCIIATLLFLLSWKWPGRPFRTYSAVWKVWSKYNFSYVYFKECDPKVRLCLSHTSFLKLFELL